MTINKLMTIANHIARTEGSTQPNGGFGPSAWRSNDGWDGTHVEPISTTSTSLGDHNSAIASGQPSVC